MNSFKDGKSMPFKISTKAELEDFISHNYNEVNAWIDEKQKGLPCLFYGSVDIRESKERFAPVDLNIYPAGFNNLCALDLGLCSEQFKKMISKLKPAAKFIGIFTESHTKNKFYLDHLFHLSSTVAKAGYEVIFFSIDEEMFEGTSLLELESHSNHPIKIFKAKLSGQKFLIHDRPLDFVIMNHD